jgi:hypothetical protein
MKRNNIVIKIAKVKATHCGLPCNLLYCQPEGLCNVLNYVFGESHITVVPARKVFVMLCRPDQNIVTGKKTHIRHGQIVPLFPHLEEPRKVEMPF